MRPDTPQQQQVKVHVNLHYITSIAPILRDIPKSTTEFIYSRMSPLLVVPRQHTIVVHSHQHRGIVAVAFSVVGVAVTVVVVGLTATAVVVAFTVAVAVVEW
jgi:hypothetical protein